MSQINNFKDLLLFEVQKAFYDERGRGARYRLTTAGVSYLKEHLKEKSGDIDEIKAWLIKNGFVENIEFEEEMVSLKIKVSNCCLMSIRDYFGSEGMEPLGCPIANMLMYALELKNGLSPELLPIKFEGGICELTLAKMATSDVVEGMSK
jgi:hypothetical protein